MFRKNYFAPLLLITLFAIGSLSGFAQTESTGGTVELKKADGTKAPAADVTVQCYRVDIKQGCRSVKTDSSGNFMIIGLPLGSNVVLAVSGPGIRPQVIPGAYGKTTMAITVDEGDGSVPTEEKVREAARAFMSQSGDLTEAQKKEVADLEKRRTEIEEKNKTAVGNNERWNTLLKEGNAAFKKGDMDTAIAKFDEGYKIDKTFLGAAPVFLNNKGRALEQRAVNLYNAATKDTDKGAVGKAFPIAAKDFQKSLEAIIESYFLSKNAKPAEISSQENHKKNIKTSEDFTKDALRIMGQIKLNLASFISTPEEATKAVKVYRDSLVILPDNPDAVSGLGIALFTSSTWKGDAGEKQESLNYMDYYMKIAPKDHKSREAVAGLITHLTKEEKLKPQKLN